MSKLNKKKSDHSKDVKFSRAGDLFHYRWAARRCIDIVYPNTPIEKITIEGSSDRNKAGEAVIDMAEYTTAGICYIQFKHSIKQLNTPFELSDFKKTIQGFAAKYKNIIKDKKHVQLCFSIITNRNISTNFKNKLSNFIKTGQIDTKLKKTLLSYTQLESKKLTEFCKTLKLIDSESNHINQLYKLKKTSSQIFIGDNSNFIPDTLTALIQEKATNVKDNAITKEDVMQRLNITSEISLFPANPYFDNVENVIIREQNDELINNILSSDSTTIIHANGGVGKSVFAQQIVKKIPVFSKDSVCIVYDCFAGGKYRSPHVFRHKYKHGLIQIINELATKDLCPPIINTSQNKETIAKAFNQNINIASQKLMKINKDAYIVIAIDAADNAKMASNDENDDCFIDYFIKESFPTNCKIVLFCRTERINILNPSTKNKKLELNSFSIKETTLLLHKYYPNATCDEIKTFHTLTCNGNPRVQSKALKRGKDLKEILDNLGPTVVTVDNQIKKQLEETIEHLKNISDKTTIDKICSGIAILPPFIPITTLSTITNVDKNSIKSFVSDFEMAFWTSDDDSIHFKDEPTETWFRDNYASNKEQISSFIETISQAVNQDIYLAEVYPHLLLKAGKYEDLIKLSLDETIKLKNPIENRKVKISTLKFAFKAAIKNNNHKDALKIAMRIGEEIAGEGRQQDLLQSNIDIIKSLCGTEKIREIAFRQDLKSKWEGSENLYSASLLSYSNKIESHKYLQITEKWLHLYFKCRKNSYDDELTDQDIIELAFTYLNLYDAKKFIQSILRWESNTLSFEITSAIFKKLIDSNEQDLINKIVEVLSNVKNINKIKEQYQYIIIAITNELSNVGQFLNSRKLLNCCLDLLSSSESTELSNDILLSAIISFLETCLNKGLTKNKIEKIVDKFFTLRIDQYILEPYNTNKRKNYFRALSIKKLASKNDYTILELLPQEFIGKEKEKEHDIKDFTNILQCLSSLYELRLNFIINNYQKKNIEIKNVFKLSSDMRKKFYGHKLSEFRQAVLIAYCDVLISYKKINYKLLNNLFNNHIIQIEYLVHDKLNFLRSTFRLTHLQKIRKPLEEHVANIISSYNDSYSDNIANLYVDMARAVMSVNKDDATIYFNKAIEIVSKFSDELPVRWNAIIELAESYNKNKLYDDELAYRFIRCAEFVYNNFSDTDINSSIKVATALSPRIAISSISRWRDRGIGVFHFQLQNLIYRLLELEVITSSNAYSLSVFFKDIALNNLLDLCLEYKNSKEDYNFITKDVIFNSRINDVNDETWYSIKDIIQKYSISNKDLDKIVNYHKSISEKENKKNNFIKQNFRKYLHNVTICSFTDLNRIMKKYRKEANSYNTKDLIEKIINNISENNRLKFLKSINSADELLFYDVVETLQIALNSWTTSISINNSWQDILKSFGKKFALKLTKYGRLRDTVKEILNDDSDIKFVQQGIIDGLKDNAESLSSDNYWGIVQNISSFISSHSETKELLNYALNRLEKDIPDDYADGKWTDKLCPPKNISETLIGLIWAVLGAPELEMRWRGVHSIKLLADLNCKDEIKYLVDWIDKSPESIMPFVYGKYPFYYLHAKLYVLIAFARISIDNAAILKDFLQKFINIALDKNKIHILIQKFSADIAINILNNFPELNEANIAEKLLSVNKSQFPLKESLDYGEFVESYLHKENKINKSIKFYLGYDFDRYWLEPLGKVFGINQQQMIEITTNVIHDNFLTSVDGAYDKEPRRDYFNSNGSDYYKTSHSHGSYPLADDYIFYISYHSMMMSASMLLQNMPVLKSKYDNHLNQLNEWMDGHLLTRKDGKWLSDRRDHPPLIRKQLKKTETWVDSIKEDDYIENLIFKKGKNYWLKICAEIQENQDYHMEKISIDSALVSISASESLLNALNNCDNPHDFKLPNYAENKFEFKKFPFELKGLIISSYVDKGIDKFDPFSVNIHYPTYELGKTFVKKLKLKKDEEGRIWTDSNNTIVMDCQTYSSNEFFQENNYSKNFRSGIQLNASVNLLKKICEKENMNIIFTVEIMREKEGYGGTKNNEKKYEPPKHKTYIFSKDGKLISSEGCYTIR